jgi:S-DNA-T family DNA segregation ATPase FtsK/SpoIIIE
LRGHAAGEPDPIQVQVSLLDDLLAVFPNGEDSAWSETLVERLADLRPELYGGWAAESLTKALKPLGVSNRQINRRTPDGHMNRRGFLLDDIGKAAEAR